MKKKSEKKICHTCNNPLPCRFWITGNLPPKDDLIADIERRVQADESSFSKSDMTLTLEQMHFYKRLAKELQQMFDKFVSSVKKEG